MDQIIIALGSAGIGGTAAVIVAVVNRGPLKRIETMVRATVGQVVNDHNSNLREDLDKVHAEASLGRAETREVRAELRTVAARQELDSIQAQVEHSRIWAALPGTDKTKPITTETEIIRLKKAKDEDV